MQHKYQKNYNTGLKLTNRPVPYFLDFQCRISKTPKSEMSNSTILYKIVKEMFSACSSFDLCAS